MSLARESSFLPTIKCSSCSRQVEISMMGEHACGGPSAELSPPPESNSRFGNAYDAPSQVKAMPAPLDTFAANRPLLPTGQLTPVSDSRTISPRSPRHRPDDDGAANYFPGPEAHDSASQRPGAGAGVGGALGGPHAGGPRKFGGSLIQRSEAISPGPFDPNRRPWATRPAQPPRSDPTVRAPSAKQSPPNHPAMPGEVRGDTASPSGVPRSNGYEGFGPPQLGDDVGPAGLGLSRSETFPKPSLPQHPPSRAGSVPGTRPQRRLDNSPSGARRRPSVGPDRSRPPPPRLSLLRPRTSGRLGSVDLAAEFGTGNPYHTPSDSGSSGYSSSSGPSQSSSQTSPARSQARRRPSDVRGSDDLMNDLESSMADLTGDWGCPDARPTLLPQEPSLLSESPHERGPVEAAGPPRDCAAAPQGQGRPIPSPLRDQLPRCEGSGGNGSFFPSSSPGRRQQSPVRYGTSPPPPHVAAAAPRIDARNPAAALPFRGQCKACGLPIRGKSISSADGRLTGKYHKACFVCAACAEPFASAEFYVLENRPYCELHYHKLNGSLCGGCGRGIEGQYLEDEALVKYHVGCFRCLDCGGSLSDGYFEVDGRAYCEPDAWRRVQASYNGGAAAPSAAPVAAPGVDADPSAQFPPPRGPPSAQRGPPPGKVGLPGRPGPRYGPAGPGMARSANGPGRRMPHPLGAAGLRPNAPQMNKRMTRLGMM